MLQDWETDVLFPNRINFAEELLDKLGWEYETMERGRLSYIIIKQRTKEEVEQYFNMEG